eukprot:COSAG06_NODE_1418_length_9522_cov_19.681312_7_plen_109_part_00
MGVPGQQGEKTALFGRRGHKLTHTVEWAMYFQTGMFFLPCIVWCGCFCWLKVESDKITGCVACVGCLAVAGKGHNSFTAGSICQMAPRLSWFAQVGRRASGALTNLGR